MVQPLLSDMADHTKSAAGSETSSQALADALRMAAAAGNAKAVELILAQPQGCAAIGVASADAGRTALHYAAANGHADIVARMLRHPEGQAALSCRDAARLTPTHRAAMHGHAKVVVAVLNYWEGRATLRAPNKYRDALVQQLAARADNTRRTTRAGMVVATSVLNAFPAAMLGDDGVLRQTLEDVAALWGWHSLALELLRFPEGHQDAVVGTKASSAAICVSSSSAYQPSLVAKFLSCGNFVAGSEMLSTYASIKPAALRAAASVFLQPITVRLSMLPEVTEGGLAKLSLGKFEFWAEQALNGARGFGTFPLRIELTMQPTLKSGAKAQLTVASVVDTSNPEHGQTTTRGKKVIAGCSVSPTEMMPKAELAVESKQSVADTQVFKPWREEPVNSGADASLATRRWVLQSLFGVRRKAVDDLECLGAVAKHFDGKPGQEHDGFDVQPDGSLGVTWSGQTWPGALQWQVPVGDCVSAWDVAFTVTSGFVGKGPLAGYYELRRFSARAALPVTDVADGR